LIDLLFKAQRMVPCMLFVM